MSQTKPSIKPEGLLRDGGAFALATSEFVLVQTYARNALALPKTMDELRSMLGPDAPSDLGEFQPLVDVYHSMFEASTKWNDQTFPATVRLASDLVQYGRKVPKYFGALREHADRLAMNEDDAVSKNKLVAILGNLEQDARRMQERAAAALAGVREYAEISQRDADTLVVRNGGGLLQKYQNKADAVNSRVAALRAELAAHQESLRAANEAHAHDATVAATTPAYAWIFPFGLIAAAVVAGVYGKKATDAASAAKRLENEIQSLSGDAAAQMKTVASLQMASISITRITTALAAALPVLRTIEGFWSAIADDLAEIARLIQDDIGNAAPIIMDLGIDEAIASWEAVAAAADKYRMAAFVNVVDLDRWKAEHPEAFAADSDATGVA